MRKRYIFILIFSLTQFVIGMDMRFKKRKRNHVELKRAKRVKLGEDKKQDKESEPKEHKLFAQIPREVKAKMAAQMIPEVMNDLQKLQPIVKLQGKNEYCNEIKFFPSGNLVVAYGNCDRSIQIFNAKNGECAGSIDPLSAPGARQNFANGYNGHQTRLELKISSDNSLIILRMFFNVVNTLEEIHVWDARTCKYLYNVPSTNKMANSFAMFSPDGSVLATAFVYKKKNTYQKHLVIHVLDAKTGKSIKVFNNDLPKFTGYFRQEDMLFSPDGNQIVIKLRNALQMWNWQKNTKPQTLKHCDVKDVINFFKFSDDGSKLCTSNQGYGSCKAKVKIWDTHTLKLLNKIVIGSYQIDGVMMNKNVSHVLLRGSRKESRGLGSYLLSTENKLFDVSKAEPRLMGMFEFNTTLTPDGSQIACINNEDNKIEIRDPKTNEVVTTLCNQHYVGTVEFINTDQLLVKYRNNSCNIKTKLYNIKTSTVVFDERVKKISKDHAKVVLDLHGNYYIMHLDVNSKSRFLKWLTFNLSIMQASIIKRMYQHKRAGRTEIAMTQEDFMRLHRMPAYVRSTLTKYMGLKMFLKQKKAQNSIGPWKYRHML